MSSNEGRQSPPPEQQSDAQLKSAPGGGQGVDDASNKEQTNKSALDSLSSNPKGALDDAVKDKFSKTSNSEGTQQK